MRQIIVYILLCISLVSYSQSTDEKLAAQFYDNKEYEKAYDLYKGIFKKNPSSIYVYENYLQTLLLLKKQKEAEKILEKQIKRNPDMMNYQVDLGYVYHFFEEKERSSKYFDKLIKKETSDRNQTIMLSSSFSRRGFSAYAIQTYEVGSKKQGTLVFYEELADAYRVASENKKLTDLILETLHKEYGTFEHAMSAIDAIFENKEDAEYLQTKTLQYAQRYPNNPVFDELLLEVYLQQKKYKAALRQIKSLDKRYNNRGSRVIQLAKICITNEEYDVAIDGYEYIVSLGKKSPIYLDAQSGLINAIYLKTTRSIKPEQEEIDRLIAKINEHLAAEGLNYQTAYAQYRQAELCIFYSDQIDKGIRLLEEIIATPRIQPTFLAKSKLLLGDGYLMQNNIWDAKLMYGQVDKQFKEDPLGQEAKFKNAKLSYYTGDFEWAKSQLDILKTATTQLISNNAIDLALLIQDNTGLDSTEDAMKEYAKAEFLLYQNDISKCEEILNLLPFKYPDHTLNDEIYYLKAQLQEKTGKYEKANELYKIIYEKYSEDILADNALYRSANITLHILNKPEEAQALFEKLILEYNTSLYAVNARKMYFGLKEGKTKEELFLGETFNN